MQRMIRHHALIRKLPAVETLGCATVVCTDKTGTLTQNAMTVVQVWTGGKSLRVSGEGYSPQGGFRLGDADFAASGDADCALLLYGALLCNDALLEERTPTMQGAARGASSAIRPEGALVVAAAKGGYWRDAANRALPRGRRDPLSIPSASG